MSGQTGKSLVEFSEIVVGIEGGDDEYDILTDEDIDELYDDFLNDSIDEEDYEEYGEYFDEVYYD